MATPSAATNSGKFNFQDTPALNFPGSAKLKLSNSDQSALVDECDLGWILKNSWALRGHAGRKYVARCVRTLKSGGCTDIKLHRAVLNAAPGQLVDHINHDRLDNRRSNLRFCTSAQNSCNLLKRKNPCTSVYKGVSVELTRTGQKRYKSQIAFSYKKYHLGCFESEIEAAKAYDIAALNLHGEFAWLNFTPGVPQ